MDLKLSRTGAGTDSYS